MLKDTRDKPFLWALAAQYFQTCLVISRQALTSQRLAAAVTPASAVLHSRSRQPAARRIWPNLGLPRPCRRPRRSVKISSFLPRGPWAIPQHSVPAIPRRPQTRCNCAHRPSRSSLPQIRSIRSVIPRTPLSWPSAPLCRASRLRIKICR